MHLPIAVSSQTEGMWDIAADMELDIEFPLLHLVYGINRFSTSEKAIQNRENQTQILSDQSTRVNAAQR